MRFSCNLCLIVIVLICVPPCAAQNPQTASARIRSAKTVVFYNETGSDVVGANAMVQLKKWGRFQIVLNRSRADLILLLSADPYRDGQIILAGGQTGTIDSRGHVEEDSVPNYIPKTVTRYAYLTVIYPETGETLWSAEHVWGGLLTGFNSVGRRLVKMLEQQTRK